MEHKPHSIELYNFLYHDDREHLKTYLWYYDIPKSVLQDYIDKGFKCDVRQNKFTGLYEVVDWKDRLNM